MSEYFHRLPDEILTNILKRIPLHDKISLESVSVRWQSVLLNHVLPSIKSLTLYQHSFAWKYHDFYQLMFFKPFNYTPYYDHNSLSLANDSLDRFKCKTMICKLPNVTKLAVYSIDIKVKYFAEIILPKWSRLETLIFGLPFDSCHYSWNEWQHVVEQSSPTNLKHLALFGEKLESVKLDWPLFGQLETLSLDNYIYKDLWPFCALFSSLSPRLRALSLSNYGWLEPELKTIESFLDANQELASGLTANLTHLTLQATDNEKLVESVDGQVLNFIGRRFKSLIHLDLDLYFQTNFTEIVVGLRPLAHLTNLRVTTLITTNRWVLPFFNNLEYRIFSGQFSEQLCLPTVTTLHLSIPVAPLPHFYSQVLPKAFPNLRVLRYEAKGKVYRCPCAGPITRKDARNVDGLFYGEYFCEGCSHEVWYSLVEENEHLQFVYRNNRVVFDRTRDSVDCEQFKLRLEQYGQSKYKIQ